MKLKLLAMVALIAIVSAGLAACAQPASGEVVKSDRQRETLPDVQPADLTAQVDGLNGFAFDLYQALKDADGNIFYSPYSISVALAMTYAGARGETESEMAETLHYLLPQDRLHPVLNRLDQELNQRGQGASGKDGRGFRLNAVNAVWGQQGYQFMDTYLDVLATNYGAGLRLVDFVSAAEESRKTINTWVSDQTEGRIKDLIPQGAINKLTRLVLTNAIYFNAAWQHPFEENMTAEGDFHPLNGSAVRVPMMKQTASMRYAEGNNFQAAELPYDGGELSMLVLVPKSGQFDPFESALDWELVDGVISDLAACRVALTMPKFEFNSSFSLKSKLVEMGMPVAFSDKADFSGMTGNHELSITDVLHKAFVSVDESGTEAAAATAVVAGVTSAPPAPPVELTIDRPFIFLIRDIPTGSIIFAGRVLNL